MSTRDHNTELANLLHEAAHPWRGATQGERSKLWKKYEKALLEAPAEELEEMFRAAQTYLKRDVGLLPKTALESPAKDTSEVVAFALEEMQEFAKKVVDEIVRQGVNLPYSPEALHLRLIIAVNNPDPEKEFLHESFREVLDLINGPGGLKRLERRVRELGYIPPENEVAATWDWQHQ